MGEPETHPLYDFGIWGRFPSPKTNSFYLWKQKDTSKKSRKIPGTCLRNNMFHKPRFLESTLNVDSPEMVGPFNWQS